MGGFCWLHNEDLYLGWAMFCDHSKILSGQMHTFFSTGPKKVNASVCEFVWDVVAKSRKSFQDHTENYFTNVICQLKQQKLDSLYALKPFHTKMISKHRVQVNMGRELQRSFQIRSFEPLTTFFAPDFSVLFYHFFSFDPSTIIMTLFLSHKVHWSSALQSTVSHTGKAVFALSNFFPDCALRRVEPSTAEPHAGEPSTSECVPRRDAHSVTHKGHGMCKQTTVRGRLVSFGPFVFKTSGWFILRDHSSPLIQRTDSKHRETSR